MLGRLNNKFLVFNKVGISTICLDEAIALIKNYDFSKPNYICVTDTYVLTLAMKDNLLTKILFNSFLTFPDGYPIMKYLQWKGFKNVSTVSGYWVMHALFKENYSHFFYGLSNNNELETMISNIKKQFPDINILGYNNPPYVDINDIENNLQIKNDFNTINKLKPDFIWIGISSPKQDYLMHHLNQTLNKGLMVGVGGVFGYWAGTQKKSPEWIKKIGMRWLFRLSLEPKRLWKKYFYCISKFILYFIIEILYFGKSKS